MGRGFRNVVDVLVEDFNRRFGVLVAHTCNVSRACIVGAVKREASFVVAEVHCSLVLLGFARDEVESLSLLRVAKERLKFFQVCLNFEPRVVALDFGFTGLLKLNIWREECTGIHLF